jgi:hypothetical protein
VSFEIVDGQLFSRIYAIGVSLARSSFVSSIPSFELMYVRL